MLSFLRKLLVVVLLGAACTLGLMLYLAPDPLYQTQEWVGRSRYRQYDGLIKEIARKRGVDPRLIKAIVWRESAFHPDKVGTSGERGLMQVGEAAASDWAKAERIETFVPTDLFDPKTNLEVGIWYFSKAMDRWKSKQDPLPFALAEYNAGRKRVDRWVAATNMGEKATSEDLLGVMDFPTTRRYIESITARFHFYQDRGL